MQSRRARAALLTLSVPLLLATACESESPQADDDGAGRGGTGAIAGSGGTTGGTGATAGSGGTTGGTGAQTGGAGAQTGGTGAQGGSSAGSGGSAFGGQGGSGAGSGGAGGSGGGAGSGAAAGSGGSGQAGSAGMGAGAAGGLAGAAGMGAAGAAGASGSGTLGSGTMTGMGRSSERYETTEVGRNGVPYMLITNGWGPGFQSHTVAWNGTSFIVEAMSGSRGAGGQPASYPSVFCGRYSVMQVPDCGLPRAMDQLTSIKTGWRWKDNGNTGAYNAAYDIWLGNGTSFGMYLMVWLRDPPGEQPAGSPDMDHQAVTVQNVPGVWDLWTGSVNSRPIINWVRREGTDISEIEFDVMDFIRDAQMRGLTITGTHVNAVAVGFEIWQGPVTNLESTDFYVDVE